MLPSLLLLAALDAADPQATITPTPTQEVVLGEKALEQFLATRKLSDDIALALRVDRIGQKVARVSDRPETVYSFLVVEGKELQAYSFTGGAICFTDTLARLYATDDQLAFALGHELAHVALRHHVSEVVFQDALAAAGARDPAAARSLQDRTSEVEADRYGALYACRAGFRFSAAEESLDLLAHALGGPDQDPAHPPISHRIAALKQLRKELDRALEAFERGTAALARGSADDAVQMLALFTASFPESVAARVNLGAAYLERARASGGTPGGLEEIVPFLPDPGVTVRGMPSALDVQRAKEHFLKAIALAPEEANASLGLALVLVREGDTEGALELLNKLLARQRSPEVLLSIGNAELVGKRTSAAVESYQAALALRKGWPAATKNLALAYESAQDQARARELWSSLVDDPTYGAEARRRLAVSAPL